MTIVEARDSIVQVWPNDTSCALLIWQAAIFYVLDQPCHPGHIFFFFDLWLECIFFVRNQWFFLFNQIICTFTEFHMILSNDSDRYHQLLGQLAFNNNPMSHFLCGKFFLICWFIFISLFHDKVERCEMLGEYSLPYSYSDK